MRKIMTMLAALLMSSLLLGSCAQSPFQYNGDDSSSLIRDDYRSDPGIGSRAAANGTLTANVMAPLYVNNGDWSAFEAQLQTVKNYGVDAVSVDVWWGDVEAAADNSFNWTYYDTIFSKIKDKGLKIVPILSFHQCGGSVGDTYTSNLPAWIWTKYNGQSYKGFVIESNDLKYKSEQGNYSNETIQLWADDLVRNEYVDFTNAFKNRFSSYASHFQEINVSAGPSGELRYPSYNVHDSGSGYPSRGALQAYSRLAVKDFQDAVIVKYGSLSGVNTAWGTNLTSVSQIQPPSNADTFFSAGHYKNTRYGKDLFDWYNGALVGHGQKLIGTVISTLGSSFPGTAVGFKIPGVHWTMAHPTYPRAAEAASGLIQTSVDFNSSSSGYGYARIIGLAKTLSASGRPIVLHFTCLEMDDQNYAPQYSLAKSLVFWVANEASRQGVDIKGENALSGGATTHHGWDNINNAYTWASYSGLTILRIGEVASGTGQARYADFIAKNRGGTGNLTVHFAEWESAATYYIHTWDGMSGDYPMSYEGYYNGKHWWKVTLTNAPASFKFCFRNSNNNWDGGNRSFTNQAREVYVKAWDNTVYTYRP